MAFYIKKSIRVGILRFNLSKSGVGVSAGIKGLRVGFGPRGNYVHAGANGFYYRKTLSPNQAKKKIDSQKQTPEKPNFESCSESWALDETPKMTEIDSNMQMLFANSTEDQLVQEMNEKFGKKSVWPFLATVSFISLAFLHPSISLLGLILCLPLYFWDKARKSVVLFYNFDSAKESEYKLLIAEFEKFTGAKAFWHIASEGKITDWKKNGGAGTQVSRNVSKFSQIPPEFICANIPVPSINVGTQILCLLPDRALLFGNSNVASISYADLKFDIDTAKFLEEQFVPDDSEITGYTWKYVNKSGGPDKRFKDNIQIPICKYEVVDLTSSTGLNERLVISKVGCSIGFKNALAKIKMAA